MREPASGALVPVTRPALFTDGVDCYYHFLCVYFYLLVVPFEIKLPGPRSVIVC